MNQAVYVNNPYVSDIKVFPDGMSDQTFQHYWNKWQDEYDLIVDLRMTVESKYLFRTDEEMPSLEERRKISWDKNFYRTTTKVAGYDIKKAAPEIYLTEDEQKAIENDKKELGRFAIWQLYGSSDAKQLVNAPVWIEEISRRVPDVLHIIVGNLKFDVNRLFGNGKVSHMGGKWSLRTSIGVLKYADLVIGPESAITNAAGAFDVPKIICYSGTREENLGGEFDNHHAFYPNCERHPCYQISVSPKHVWNLEKRNRARDVESFCRIQDPFDPYRFLGYRCTLRLPQSEIVEKAVEILSHCEV